MCHQSVGLIARAIEAVGIPTVSLTSAWSITAAVRPPRAAFVDHPLGHTAGKPFDRAGQRRISRAALDLLGACKEPGTIVDLAEIWGSDDWRGHPLGGGGAQSGGAGGRGGGASGRAAEPGRLGGAVAGGDTRTARFDTPQYQSEADARAAAERLGADAACAACIVFDS